MAFVSSLQSLDQLISSLTRARERARANLDLLATASDRTRK